MTGADARAALVTDIEYEAALTRTLLRRVPEAAIAWAPHARAFSLGALASHLAELPHWGAQILATDAYDFDTARPGHRERATMAEVMEVFERHLAEFHVALFAQQDEHLLASWTLRRGMRVIMATTRVDAVRRLALHHLIHHRGQLTVYLRMLNVPPAPLYGPTADEQP
jgi:uncharacterized damage-inducible protein DinB